MNRIIALLCAFSVSLLANAKDADSTGTRTGIRYMGMVSVNVSPYLPFSDYYCAPSGSLHTSHGVFLEKYGLYTGISAEHLWTLVPVFQFSAHLRYYYGKHPRVGGYAGAELGAGVNYMEGGTSFHGAPEVGMLIKFRKVAIDIGVRAQFILPEAREVMFLPFRVGIVF